MEGIIPELRSSANKRLIEKMRECRDAKLKTRYLIIINLAEKKSPTQTAGSLKVARSTVYRVAKRFREAGEVGLVDRREENGEKKLDERYLAELHKLVASSPLTAR